MARLVGFIANRPDLCNRFAAHEERVLSAHSEERSPWGWGVGFYQAGEILLKRRPLDERKQLTLDEMISDVRSDILIAHVRRATVGSLTTSNTHPFRYRQWIWANTGTLGAFGQLGARLLESLPQFLRRAVKGETDSELLFHLFLSFLHDAGKLDRPTVSVEDCGPALTSCVALVDRLSRAEGIESPTPLNILVATPDYLIATRRGAPMAHRVLAGRGDFEPLYEQRGPEKLRMPDLQPCRLSVVAGNFHDDTVPDGWTEVPCNEVMAFTRTDEPTSIASI